MPLLLIGGAPSRHRHGSISGWRDARVNRRSTRVDRKLRSLPDEVLGLRGPRAALEVETADTTDEGGEKEK
jgi:hypothetical protein